MASLSCGAEKTIEAHLIAKAFVMEVKRDRGEQHLIIHQGNRAVSQARHVRRDILRLEGQV